MLSDHSRTNEPDGFLKLVKDTFKDNREIYDDFLKLLQDYKTKRIDIIGLKLRINQLFKDHCELLEGFNTFLAKGNDMEVSFEKAIDFTNKVQFAKDEQSYAFFLQSLKNYRKDEKSKDKIIEEMFVLFRNEEQLLEEFIGFM